MRAKRSAFFNLNNNGIPADFNHAGPGDGHLVAVTETEETAFPGQQQRFDLAAALVDQQVGFPGRTPEITSFQVNQLDRKSVV